eukprot:TRINITY_DN31392_c0_g1_i1.p1 TRINITY_DN31392_c0_g1~~TRINITY_DN31392_c0_g1_i1.p1  ORF type:complete len:250 (+),score=39.96 TRINITY_DN31392_c0_g1_i1:103-750(+)
MTSEGTEGTRHDVAASVVGAVSQLGAGEATASDATFASRAEAATMAVKLRLNALVEGSPAFVQVYAGTLKPWSQFWGVSLPIDESDLRLRVEHNLIRFSANYFLILILFLVLMLMTHLWRLAVTVLIVGMWAIFVRKGGMDPTWMPKIGNVVMPPLQRALLMCAISVITLFFVAGDLVLMLVGLSFLISVAHAALHADDAAAVTSYNSVPTQDEP